MTLVQFDTDVCINIFRRRENISYKRLYDANNAAISFFEDISVMSSDFVSGVDRSSSIATNRSDPDNEAIVLEGISSQVFETNQILISDEFSTRTDGTKIPLFSQHIISTENVSRVSDSDLTLSSGVSIPEILVLDKDFEEVFVQDIYFDFDKGIVYNNLYNVLSHPRKIYYIKYTVKSGSDLFTYTEILNNQDVYSEATFDDLDEDLNIINDGRKVFIISQVDNNFEIILPTGGDYGFKVKNNSRIQILPFDNSDFTFPWFARVSNGSFHSRLSGVDYQYYIAQFSDQTWNPEAPYKKVENELSQYIRSDLLKLNRENILNSSADSFYIDILVNDQHDSPLVAFTTNPSLHDTTASNGAIYIYWSFSTKLGIRSIDYLNGLIDIEGYELKDSYKIYSTYYFEEKEFELDSVDLNPLGNRDILDRRLVLFIIPDDDVTTSEKTLYYLLVDKRNRVVESDWDSFSNVNQLTTSGKELYYEGVPSFITPGGTYEVFMDTYTIIGDGIYLIIGDMTVESPVSVKDLEYRDARVPGGGLIEDRVSDAKKENPEVIWYWDLGRWDGEFYPGNASYYVEVPVSVLSGAGGTFTQKRVRDVVEKHTGFGIYPVVKAYGVDPYIKDVEPSTTSIYIEWYSYGSDKRYNVYYSQNRDGPWTKANGSLISDVSTGNSYTITSLTSGVYYYIMIVGGILDDGEFLAQCGQAISPVEDGVKNVYNFNVAKVKTR